MRKKNRQPAADRRSVFRATFGGTNWKEQRNCRPGVQPTASPRCSSSAAARPGLSLARDAGADWRGRASSWINSSVSATAGRQRYHSLALPQRHALQPSAVHAVSGCVAHVSAEGHAGGLVRSVCVGDGKSIFGPATSWSAVLTTSPKAGWNAVLRRVDGTERTGAPEASRLRQRTGGLPAHSGAAGG